MSTRFFPRNDSDLSIWLTTYRTQLPLHGKQVGLDATAIKEQQELCDELVASIAADEKAYADFRAAVARTAEVRSRVLKGLSSRIDQIRVHPGFSEATRTALGLVSPSSEPTSLGELKLPLSLEALPGRVVVKWRKGPLDGVNVYSQRGGETAWLLLGRDNRPPYEDLRPLAQPGQPEVRRYRVVGVVEDREVTPPSDTAQITVSD